MKLLGIKRFIVTGKVSDEELAFWYNIADVFMFCSLYEGFGIPPLEAMACNTAVVSSNISCMPEIYQDAAVLVNPYSAGEIYRALETLYNDKSMRTG